MASKTKPEARTKILPGVKVRTAPILRQWTGMGGSGPNVKQRRVGAIGVAHHALPGLSVWYVQHDGDACLTVYRASELTPVPGGEAVTGGPAYAAAPDLAKIETLFTEVEAQRAALVDALQRLAAEVPDAAPWSMLRAQAEGTARDAGKVGEVGRWRSMVAEIQRPKGPMVEIHYPSRHIGRDSTGTAELAEITSGAFVMHSGARYSRKTGLKIGHTDRWSPAPRIAAEERVRVLALGWKPPKGTP